VAIHQAIQYARSCLLADGRRNSGDRRVSIVVDMHTLVANELLIFGTWHTRDLDPEYAACKVGKEQSPIDIQDAEKAELPSVRFEYRGGPLRIINNGYTAVRVNYAPGNPIDVSKTS
jgi:hypothetical protein